MNYVKYYFKTVIFYKLLLCLRINSLLIFIIDYNELGILLFFLVNYKLLGKKIIQNIQNVSTIPSIKAILLAFSSNIFQDLRLRSARSLVVTNVYKHVARNVSTREPIFAGPFLHNGLQVYPLPYNPNTEYLKP